MSVSGLNHKNKIYNYLFTTLLSSCVLFGCQDEQETSIKNANVASSQQISPNKTLPNYLVATTSSFPPFILRDKYGKSIGFDVDILNAIAKEEGFTVSFLPQPWNTALPSLNDDSRDIVATGVVITPEREVLYDFSDPYLDTGWLAVLKKPTDNKDEYKSFIDLRLNPNLVYVSQDSAAGEAQLNTFLTPLERKKLKSVDTQYQEIQSIMNGDADVAFDISRVLQYYIHSNRLNGQLYSIEQPNMTHNQLGFAVKKGRDDLRKKINDGLKKIKENGVYDKIVEKWYGKKK